MHTKYWLRNFTEKSKERKYHNGCDRKTKMMRFLGYGNEHWD
jgi:hypothetical protein